MISNCQKNVALKYIFLKKKDAFKDELATLKSVKNGFECSKHQTLRFSEDFVLTTEEVTLRIMLSLSQYPFVLGDSLLTKLFRSLIP